MLVQVDLDSLPRVLMMGQVGQPMGFTSHVARTKEHILILVRDGDMHFQVCGGTFALTGGEWLLIPSGEEYRLHSRQGCQYTFIHFDLPQPLQPVENAAMPTLKTDPLAFPYTLPCCAEDHLVYLRQTGCLEGGQEKIWPMLTECDMHRHALTADRKLRIDLRFAEMLSLLDARNAQSAPAGYPPVLSRMLVYIHEHYTEPITLAALSDEFHLSRQYIMRLFQKHLHITVTRYITQLKLSHALELLRHSSFRIGEAAEMLGYASTYYFCRLFKQQFGMTPTEYIRHGLEGE